MNWGIELKDLFDFIESGNITNDAPGEPIPIDAEPEDDK